jgi:pyruvate ferredoxin oxidoreductase alpha subunit
MGAFAPPAVYSECRKAQDVAVNGTIGAIQNVWNEFSTQLGRQYNLIETYKTEDAETILVSIGSFNQMASVAVDKLRAAGKKVGLVRVRLWRPFPLDAFRQAIKSAKNVVVFERSMSYGGTVGPVCAEIKSALYGIKNAPRITSFIGGLGGRDMSPKQFEVLFNRAQEIFDKNLDIQYETIGVRE